MLKLTKQVLLVVLMGAVATAQTATAKPAAGKTTPVAPPASQTVKPAAKPASTVSKPAASAPAKVTKKAPAKQADTKPGRRDPFINPVRVATEKTGNSPACTTGARCLAIDQVVLKGVVKTHSGMIAMVENATKKSYNLREKDPVFNGFVLKITGDSIVFRETTTDNMGHPATREVVKRVTVPVV